MSTVRTLDDLRQLGAQVQAAEKALEDARRERDEAIRDLRKHSRHTAAELAEAALVSLATVKAVTRGLR